MLKFQNTLNKGKHSILTFLSRHFWPFIIDAAESIINQYFFPVGMIIMILQECDFNL